MLKTVQENREAFIDMMKESITYRSYACQEEGFAKYMLAKLQELPVDEAFIDGAGNVVAIIRGEGTGPNVILNGHLDVVPEGNLENWAPYDPFEPNEVEGRLIGRGICDLKAGLVAQYYAFKAFAERAANGKRPSGDITFTAVVQEEPAEMFGILYFFDYTMKEHDIKGDVVYLCEPTDGDLAIGQRGKIELVVKTFGRTAHSSVPSEGINAFQYMAPIVCDIFDHKGFNLKPDPELGETTITVTNCIVKPGELSMIPDECEISVDRRYSAEQTDEDLMAEFEAVFDHYRTAYPEFKASVEPRYFDETSWTGYKKRVKKIHPPWIVPRDNEFVVKTFEALREIGQDPKEHYKKAGTDGGCTCAYHKIPTIIYSHAPNAQAHQPKEYVVIDEMVQTYEGYIAILAKVYGVDLEEFN